MSTQEYTVVNAIITKATIGFDRDVFLSTWVHVEYDTGGQGFGGRVIGGTPDCNAGRHSTGGNYAAEEIVGILRAADVERWDQLPGKAVRVKREAGWNGLIVAIGHITKNDRWYEPKKVFESWKAGA